MNFWINYMDQEIGPQNLVATFLHLVQQEPDYGQRSKGLRVAHGFNETTKYLQYQHFLNISIYISLYAS